MKNFLKIQSRNFCNQINSNFKFSSIKKDNYCIERKEKISILEYFNIIPERNHSNQQQSLLKELILYVNSDNFQREFKYSLSNENRIFKFYLLNISLLSHRIDEVKSEIFCDFAATKKKNIFNNFNKNIFHLLLLNYSLRFFPLHFIYDEFYNEYAKKYLIKDSFQEVFTEKFFKKMKMLDIKYLRYRGLFAKELNVLNTQIEAFYDKESNHDKKFEDLLKENEAFKKKYELFLKKYFINFIFEVKSQDKAKQKAKGDKENNKLDELQIYAKDVDKLFTYFLAHVNIIKIKIIFNLKFI